MNEDTQTPDAPSATPAPEAEPPPDLTSILEARLAAEAPQSEPAEGAVGAPNQEPQKPQEAPQEPPKDAPKDSAAEAFARALAAERKAQEASRAAKEERAKLDAEKAAIAAEREKFAKELEEAREIARLLRDDPRALVRRVGESPEEFVKRLARGERVDPKIRELEERLDREAKAREEERAKAQQEAQQRAEEERKQAETAAVAEFTRVVKASPECEAVAWLLDSDPDTAIGMLRDAVQRHHADTGKIPTYEEAAKSLQDTLMADFERMLSVPAFRARAEVLVGASRPAPKSATATTPAQHASQGAATADVPRTLTQDMTTAAGAGNGERELSEEERFERMVRKLEAATRG